MALPPGSDEQKYWAFVSYSSKDLAWGRWLIKALEGFRVPRSLVGLKTACGSIPRRLYPVFRDRDELRASADVAQELQKGLADSRFLIVVCSPRSAAPTSWVNREVEAFKAIGREEDVLALIVDGEPNASERPGSEADECFPHALRYQFDDAGRMTSQRADPLAADVRREDERPRASRRKALLKLIACIIDVDFDTLEQRDRRRRRLQALTWSGIGSAVLAIIGILAAFGLNASRVSLSHKLAKEARSLADSEMDLALLLSATAHHISPTATAFESLLTNLRHQETLLRYVHRARAIPAIAFDREETVIAVASCAAESCDRSTVVLYDLKTYQLRRAAIPIAGQVRHLAFAAPAGTLLIARSGGEGQEIVALDTAVPDGTPSRIYGDNREIIGLSTSDDGWRYALALQRGEVKVYDRQEGGKLCDFVPCAGHGCDGKQEPVAMAFSADGRYFAASGGNAFALVELKDLASCRPATYSVGGIIDSIAFAPSSDEIYVAAMNGFVYPWRLPIESREPEPITFGPDIGEGRLSVLDSHARHAVVKHGDHLRFYDLDLYREMVQEEQQRPSDIEVARIVDLVPEQVTFSPSGQLVATIDRGENAARGEPSDELELWRITGDPLVEVTTHNEEPASKPEALSADGSLRAQVKDKSENCTYEFSAPRCRAWTELQLIDGASGLEIITMRGPNHHPQGQLGVSFTKDGNIAVVGDRMREVWKVSPKELTERACRIANRSLLAEEVKRYLEWQRWAVGSVNPCDT